MKKFIHWNTMWMLHLSFFLCFCQSDNYWCQVWAFTGSTHIWTNTILDTITGGNGCKSDNVTYCHTQSLFWVALSQLSHTSGKSVQSVRSLFIFTFQSVPWNNTSFKAKFILLSIPSCNTHSCTAFWLSKSLNRIDSMGLLSHWIHGLLVTLL